MRVSSTGIRFTLFAFATLQFVVARAEGQEYCVTCSDPPGLYRCIIEGAKPGGAQSLQMFCVTTMAKQGRHGKCAVKGGTVFDCDGQVKRVPWSAQGEAPPATGQTVGKAPAISPKEPPRTVEEMARRAKESSSEGPQSADAKEKSKTLGENIGEATKKTWRCFASLFTRCSD